MSDEPREEDGPPEDEEEKGLGLTEEFKRLEEEISREGRRDVRFDETDSSEWVAPVERQEAASGETDEWAPPEELGDISADAGEGAEAGSEADEEAGGEEGAAGAAAATAGAAAAEGGEGSSRGDDAGEPEAAAEPERADAEGKDADGDASDGGAEGGDGTEDSGGAEGEADEGGEPEPPTKAETDRPSLKDRRGGHAATSLCAQWRSARTPLSATDAVIAIAPSSTKIGDRPR